METTEPVLLYVCSNCDLVAGDSDNPPVTLDRCPRCGWQKFTTIEQPGSGGRGLGAAAVQQAAAAPPHPPLRREVERPFVGGFLGLVSALRYRHARSIG